MAASQPRVIVHPTGGRPERGSPRVAAEAPQCRGTHDPLLGRASQRSLLDKIKDILTTDDAEKAAKAKEVADEAARQADEAAQRAAAAKQAADDAAAKAGLGDATADAAKQAADAAAADAAHRAQEAADQARAVQELHEREAAAAAEKAAAEAASAEKAAAEKAAAAAAAEAAEHHEELKTYTVVKGDTLSEIGQRFGVNWRDIAALNHIKNPDLIYPGQVFKIPAK